MDASVKIVSLKQLAQILGKSENSLRYHVRLGRIKPAFKFGRTMSFDLDDVFRQLKRGIRN